MVVRAHDGRALVVEFSGVESLDEHRAVGMTLYALSEFEEAGDLRRFVFANWDDEDDARLELLARDFTCVERSSTSSSAVPRRRRMQAESLDIRLGMIAFAHENTEDRRLSKWRVATRHNEQLPPHLRDLTSGYQSGEVSL